MSMNPKTRYDKVLFFPLVNNLFLRFLLFVLMHMFINTHVQEQLRTEEGARSPKQDLHVVMSCMMSMMGTELGCSSGAGSTVNRWAISPAL